MAWPKPWPRWKKFNARTYIDGKGHWMWLGALNRDGYGLFTFGRRDQRLAHRVSWERHRGPIPESFEIDHMCRVRACINPAHLRVVPCGFNGVQGSQFHATKTHCPSGHPYDKNNTYVTKAGHRQCKACHRIRERDRYRRKVGIIGPSI